MIYIFSDVRRETNIDHKVKNMVKIDVYAKFRENIDPLW